MTFASIARSLRWAALGVLLGAAVIALFLQPAHTFAAEPSSTSVPSVGAADLASDAPPDLPPSADPADPGDPDDGQGEVVIDGPFVTPTPEGTVELAIGEPHLTPPPTDADAVTGSLGAGDGMWTPMIVLAAASGVALATAQAGLRRRSASPATRTTRGRRTRP